MRVFVCLLVLAVASCSDKPPTQCADAPCSPVRDMRAPTEDFALPVYDVGLAPAKAFAVVSVFGGGEQPTASTLCAQLGTGFRPATSSTGIDVAKLNATPGYFFTDSYGTLNNANQLVACSVQFGEPVIFGGGSAQGGGLKSTQPAPCFGFTRFYACQSGAVQCGSTLETTSMQIEGWGLLCSTM